MRCQHGIVIFVIGALIFKSSERGKFTSEAIVRLLAGSLGLGCIIRSPSSMFVVRRSACVGVPCISTQFRQLVVTIAQSLARGPQSNSNPRPLALLKQLVCHPEQQN